MAKDTQPTMSYPTTAQHGQWKRRAEEMEMSLSEYIQAMVEAGHKKFRMDVQLDQSAGDLRQQRNDLKDELARARRRIEKLEDELHHGEKATIERYIAENPGASFRQVVQHVAETIPSRVLRILEGMEGETVETKDDGYHPLEGDQ